MQNATVRVIFTMGGDGVLPRSLGKVHRSYHSPYVAIYALTALAIALGISLAAWLGSGITDVYGWTGSIGTVAVVLVYMLANIALIKYFWKDSERNILHVIVPLAGIAALAYPLYFVAKPGQPHPYSLVPYVVLAWIVLGFAAYFYLRSQAPDKLEAVGRAIAEEEDDLAEGHLVSAPV